MATSTKEYVSWTAVSILLGGVVCIFTAASLAWGWTGFLLCSGLVLIAEGFLRAWEDIR